MEYIQHPVFFLILQISNLSRFKNLKPIYLLIMYDCMFHSILILNVIISNKQTDILKMKIKSK